MKRNNPLEEKYISAMVEMLSGICKRPEGHITDPEGFLSGVKSIVSSNPWCWDFANHLGRSAPMASEKPVG